MATPVYDYDKDIPAGFYDEIHQRRAGVRFFWHDLKFRAVAARLDGVGKVLDVGCGPGTLIGNYLDGAECLGIDVSAPQVDYANRRYGTASHRFSTQALPGLGERFDAITMIEVIEHLPPADARAEGAIDATRPSRATRRRSATRRPSPSWRSSRGCSATSCRDAPSS